MTAASVLAFLLNDSQFRQMVTPKVLMVLGAILVALITIRSFIDKSSAGHKMGGLALSSVASPPAFDEPADDDAATGATSYTDASCGDAPVPSARPVPSSLSKTTLRSSAGARSGGTL